MSSVQLKALRPMMAAGKQLEAGATFSLPAHEAADACDSGRCEPASEADAEQMRAARSATNQALAERLNRLSPMRLASGWR